MGIHVLNKGKEGEREAIKFLQPTVNKVYVKFGLVPPQLYRNQNQSALGGYDIDGLDWIALEIKRQETLNLNAWWKQVNKAANGDQFPVVMFRQNRKQWRFLVHVHMHTGGQGFVCTRAEINKDDFLYWFEATLERKVKEEYDL